MIVTLPDGTSKPISLLTLDEWRKFMAEFMSENPNASAAWDIMGCVRGPDFPSERPDMTPNETSKAYAGRRERKYRTVEILREVMFFGACGGCARHHKDNKVILPPTSQWDHFDRHVQRGASRIGLKVEIRSKNESLQVNKEAGK